MSDWGEFYTEEAMKKDGFIPDTTPREKTEISKEELNRVMLLDFSYDDICKHFNVSYPTIKKAIREHRLLIVDKDRKNRVKVAREEKKKFFTRL